MDQDKITEAMALLEQMAMQAGDFEGLRKTKLGEEPAAEAGVERRAPAGAGAGLGGSPQGRSKRWEPDLRYRSLVEKLPVVTFMAGFGAEETLQELYVSPYIEALLGFTQSEWIEDPFLWFRQLHPEDRERWVEEFARTCSMGTHFRAEYRLIARDGHVVWVQGECQVIRDENGKPLFLQGIAFDITHIKRSAQIEEAKLEAEAANRAKSEFLARMSHEIRTPLNGVVGMIDLMRATELTPVQHRYATLCGRRGMELLTVINDILDFSKIEAGKVEIEAIEFDLAKLLEDLTELLGPMAVKKNLWLAYFLRPDVPTRVMGDPTRIRQVLTNLINNALKFTLRGSVTIRTSLVKSDADGAIVKVAVEDTGIGIPADRMDRLFKSFSQVDSSTTRQFGGTGLGLAISKKLVELMGGEIGIESKEGSGTTFWFTLRVGVNAEEEKKSVPHPADALRSVRVLAIEPDPIYQRILSEQFEGWLAEDSTIRGFDNAFEGLKRAVEAGHPYAVVLVPHPTANGQTLINAIRGDEALKNSHLIAVMDAGEVVEKVTLREAGFVASVNRPINQSQLLDSIASVTVKRELANTPAKSGEKSATTDALKGMHVLVAEDNEMNQFVTEETLRRVGVTCDIVGNGQEALEAITRRGYDAVLMDCQMPVMDGLEATRRIREREAKDSKLGRIAVIALTAEAIQGDREKCIAAGMDGYVSKPINAADLFAAIGALGRKPGATLLAAKAAVAGEKAADAANAGGKAAEPAVAKEASLETSLLDLEEMFNRCMRNVKLAVTTLEKFSLRVVADVDLFKKGVMAKDAAGATRLAHNFAQAAVHVSAVPLRRIAIEIENAGKRGDLDFIESQLGELACEVERCRAYVPEAIARINTQKTAVEPKNIARST